MLIPRRDVAEIVRRLSGLPGDADSWDRAEVLMELEEEFGAEAVRWALRFIEAARIASENRRR